MAEASRRDVQDALRHLGVELSDEDVSTLAAGEPIRVDEGQVERVARSSETGQCDGIKLMDLPGGCGLYFKPFPPALYVCC